MWWIKISGVRPLIGHIQVMEESKWMDHIMSKLFLQSNSNKLQVMFHVRCHVKIYNSNEVCK